MDLLPHRYNLSLVPTHTLLPHSLVPYPYECPMRCFLFLFTLKCKTFSTAHIKGNQWKASLSVKISSHKEPRITDCLRLHGKVTTSQACALAYCCLTVVRSWFYTCLKLYKLEVKYEYIPIFNLIYKLPSSSRWPWTKIPKLPLVVIGGDAYLIKWKSREGGRDWQGKQINEDLHCSQPRRPVFLQAIHTASWRAQHGS